MVLDPLAWHLALLLVASGAGLLLNKWIVNTTGLDLPSYLLAFLVAIAMFLFFRKTGVSHYIDENVISRISGTATDYLVFFGIAPSRLRSLSSTRFLWPYCWSSASLSWY